MKEITKLERDAILRVLPDTYIRRTMSHKSKRHRYYCEESAKVIKFLNKFHSENLVRQKEV